MQADQVELRELVNSNVAEHADTLDRVCGEYDLHQLKSADHPFWPTWASQQETIIVNVRRRLTAWLQAQACLDHPLSLTYAYPAITGAHYTTPRLAWVHPATWAGLVGEHGCNVLRNLYIADIVIIPLEFADPDQIMFPEKTSTHYAPGHLNPRQARVYTMLREQGLTPEQAARTAADILTP